MVWHLKHAKKLKKINFPNYPVVIKEDACADCSLLGYIEVYRGSVVEEGAVPEYCEVIWK